jgi:hypothetical protein
MRVFTLERTKEGERIGARLDRLAPRQAATTSPRLSYGNTW